MNNFDWEFSKEVEPDLLKLLEIVNQEENKECQLEKRVFELFPEYQELQKDLEKSFVEIKETSKIEEPDIIVIDDDSNDAKIKTENEIKIDLPDVSLLNLTEKIKIEPQEEIINEDADQVINYLRECFQNDSVLDKQYITKLTTFNETTLNYLFNKLCEMPDNGIYILNKSLCSTNESLNDVPKYFCKNILFQKLQQNPKKNMLVTTKEFYDKFSEETRRELLNIFLVSETDNNNFYQTIISMFSNNQKLLFLQDFVLTANEIEVWHLSVLNSLITDEIEDSIKRRLINLMNVSTDKFKNEKLFMKLLISIINTLEANFEDQIQIISNIIEKSKTANKISAQNALKKWVNKFSSQDLL